MNMYTVKFFNHEGERYDFAQFYVDWDSEKLMDKLEETLWIMAELEPKSKNWKHELATYCSTIFANNNGERTLVSYGWDDSNMIMVKDLRG